MESEFFNFDAVLQMEKKKSYYEGYQQGEAYAIDEFVKAMRKLWGGLKAMDEIESVGEQLKEQRKAVNDGRFNKNVYF